MEKNALAIATIDLRLSTRKACNTQPGVNKKLAFPLDASVLFLVKDRPRTPGDIVAALCMQKSNLAAVARGLEERELIIRKKLSGRRDTSYNITPKGRAYLNDKLSEVETNFKKFLSTEEEYVNAAETLQAAVRLMAFLAQ